MPQVTTSRRATFSDASVMARIAEQAYAPYLERMTNGQRPAPMDTEYEERIAATEAWVAEAEGEVIGFLILVDEGDGMLLDGVAVLPSHQGLGAGRHLLTLAETRARAAGYDHIRLYTNEVMVENQGLYERSGYRETHRASEDGFSRVFYDKALAD